MSTEAVEIARLRVSEIAALPFPKQRPMLVCVSGVGGSGKTRVAQILESDFRRHGIQVQYQWLSGGTSSMAEILGRLGRRLTGARAWRVWAGGAEPAAERALRRACWQAVVGLDLLRFSLFRVRLPLLLGKVVICDRYTFDTFSDLALAYERDPAAQGMNAFERFFHWVYPVPDVHYLLVADGPLRMGADGHPDAGPASGTFRGGAGIYLQRYQACAGFSVRRVDRDVDRTARRLAQEALLLYWRLGRGGPRA